MIRLTRLCIRSMAWIGGVGTLFLMFPTVVDVAYRGLFGPSVPGMVEYSEIGLVIVIYLGIASAFTEGSHIHTPLLTARLPGSIANRLRLFGRCAMWILIALTTVATFRVAQESFAIREFRFGLVEVPIWPAKAFIPIGFLALLAETSIQIYEYSRGGRQRDGSA